MNKAPEHHYSLWFGRVFRANNTFAKQQTLKVQELREITTLKKGCYVNSRTRPGRPTDASILQRRAIEYSRTSTSTIPNRASSCARRYQRINRIVSAQPVTIPSVITVQKKRFIVISCLKDARGLHAVMTKRPEFRPSTAVLREAA